MCLPESPGGAPRGRGPSQPARRKRHGRHGEHPRGDAGLQQRRAPDRPGREGRAHGDPRQGARRSPMPRSTASASSRTASTSPASTTRRPARPAPAQTTIRDEGTVRVPVYEERLDVEKREVELGEVRLHKTVEEEEVSVPVELRREEVTVDRRDVDARPVEPGAADTAFQETTIRVPVRGEEAVVDKQAVVTGEVVVTKEQTTERQEITDTVRKERVDIDDAYQRFQPDFQRQLRGAPEDLDGRPGEVDLRRGRAGLPDGPGGRLRRALRRPEASRRSSPTCARPTRASGAPAATGGRSCARRSARPTTARVASCLRPVLARRPASLRRGRRQLVQRPVARGAGQQHRLLRAAPPTGRPRRRLPSASTSSRCARRPAASSRPRSQVSPASPACHSRARAARPGAPPCRGRPAPSAAAAPGCTRRGCGGSRPARWTKRWARQGPGFNGGVRGHFSQAVAGHRLAVAAHLHPVGDGDERAVGRDRGQHLAQEAARQLVVVEAARALKRRYQALQSASVSPRATSSWVTVRRAKANSAPKTSATARWKGPRLAEGRAVGGQQRQQARQQRRQGEPPGRAAVVCSGIGLASERKISPARRSQAQ